MEEWIEFYTNGRYTDCAKDVIEFIANFVGDRTNNDILVETFASGYCYYFAQMLQSAFNNRGTVCWHRNHAHIVWVDSNNIAYDIYGVFEDYEDGDLLPVNESLDNLIVDFMHNGESYTCYEFGFHDFAEHYKLSDCEAITRIYMMIPKEEIDDSITVEENAINYWTNNEHNISIKFAELKHRSNQKN